MDGGSVRPTWTSECGTVQLYLGDCLDVLPTLAPGSVDAVVTDPPYGIAYDASTSSQRGIQRFSQLTGDDRPFDATPFIEFADALIWCCPQLTTGVPVGLGAWYSWDKTLQNNGCRIGECEYAWHKLATKTRVFRHLWSGAYRASEAGEKAKHPTQKPILLMEWCLKLASGEIVLDPYMGSGTTGVACVRLGRRFVGVEIDPGYFEIAKRRIQDELRRVEFLEPKRAVERQASLFGDGER